MKVHKILHSSVVEICQNPHASVIMADSQRENKQCFVRLVKIQEWSGSIYEVKTPDAWQQRENELLED